MNVPTKIAWCLLLTVPLISCSIDFTQTDTTSNSTTINVDVHLTPQQSLLKDTLTISLDSPDAHMGTVAYQTPSQKTYVSEFAQTKEIFQNDVHVSVPVTSLDQNTAVHLHVSFLTLPDHTMNEGIHAISFAQDTATNGTQSMDDATASKNYQSANQPEYHEQKNIFRKTLDRVVHFLENIVQKNNNLWIRLLFALLLGLLLSLTPCIYPMIPITIGVLHSNQQGQSVLRNFLGSMCYAFGLSTTFATLGLFAAFFGQSFGSLLSNPIFVLILVAFIGYMSLTMIGILELKLPAALQRGTNYNSKFGPFLSVFLFGLISGSVASPCVSPGLALLLTIVATMGNIFSGFLLLFFFGIGLSVPLIIIGTFSSSLSMLPQAGQWMVEVKKALGFVMLATCIYYLNNIIPANFSHWLIAAYLLFAALFYIIDAQKDVSSKPKTIKSFVGIILLALAIAMGMRNYIHIPLLHSEIEESGVVWADSYDAARASAQAEGKLLLLDFWANHCTICKAIDKKLFKKDRVYQALQDKIMFVKVDCTSNANNESNMLKTTFKVFAQPAILLVNPSTQEIIKKWSSEPYSMTPEEFVATVEQLSK